MIKHLDVSCTAKNLKLKDLVKLLAHFPNLITLSFATPAIFNSHSESLLREAKGPNNWLPILQGSIVPFPDVTKYSTVTYASKIYNRYTPICYAIRDKSLSHFRGIQHETIFGYNIDGQKVFVMYRFVGLISSFRNLTYLSINHTEQVNWSLDYNLNIFSILDCCCSRLVQFEFVTDNAFMMYMMASINPTTFTNLTLTTGQGDMNQIMNDNVVFAAYLDQVNITSVHQVEGSVATPD